jgi:hypothetical protein
VETTMTNLATVLHQPFGSPIAIKTTFPCNYACPWHMQKRAWLAQIYLRALSAGMLFFFHTSAKRWGNLTTLSRYKCATKIFIRKISTLFCHLPRDLLVCVEFPRKSASQIAL